MEHLKIGLVHLNVRHNQAENNRNELVQHNRAAAESGAKIVVNTELAVSGYSYRSREDIADAVESVDGPTCRSLAAIASRYGIYIVIGFAERDAQTGIYYNAAVALSPEGKVAAHYRKISAETRWACPGNPLQQNTFDTPWGRIGLLICSDTYFGAIPRMSALRGTDLLLVPANWPADPLDPGELWQARAYENGIFIAACNRCGMDRTMVFKDTWSCVYGPCGETLMNCSSSDSSVFYAQVPLDRGKLASRSAERLQSRKPGQYTPLYLDMRYADDLSSYYELPTPTERVITVAAAQQEQVFSPDAVDRMIAGTAPATAAHLIVLPIGIGLSVDEAEETLARLAVRHRADLCAGITDTGRQEKGRIILADSTGRITRYPLLSKDSDSARLCMVDIAGARVLIAAAEELLHPELTLAAAKLGCDMAISSTGECLDDRMHQALATRSIEQLYIAVAGNHRAFICEPPEGHLRWKEVSSNGNSFCTMRMDTNRSRHKRYYDRFDLDLLLDRRISNSATIAEKPQIHGFRCCQIGAGTRIDCK